MTTMLSARRSRKLCLSIGGLLVLLVVSTLSIKHRVPPSARLAGPLVGHVPFDERVMLAPRPVTVAPGVHLLGAMRPSAVYVIETSTGLVLVDTGFAEEQGALIQQMDALGLDPSQVRAILLTHAHGDHSLGAMPLKRRSGATIYAGRDDAQVIREGGPPEAIFSNFEIPAHVTHPTDVDVELAGDEVLQFGDKRIEVLATPGHTPGSTCYVLSNGGTRVFFGGDTISTSLELGTYAAYLAPRYRGDARAYLATLRKLAALPSPDMLLPGHPGHEKTPQDPHIAPAHWFSMLDHGIQELEALIERYETDGADFLDGQPKELLPGLHYLGDIEGFAVYVLAAPSQLLLFDAPGGQEFPDWFDARLRCSALGPRSLTATLLTSCSPEAISGLPSLVEKTGCQVLSSESGVAMLRGLGLPDAKLRSIGSPRAAGWIEFDAFPLADVRPGAMAYIIEWAGKKVLVSGRMPVQISTADRESLTGALAGRPEAINAYRESLYRLLGVDPDLWLPAKPLHGRNANWYSNEWQNLVWYSISKLQHIKPN